MLDGKRDKWLKRLVRKRKKRFLRKERMEGRKYWKNREKGNIEEKILGRERERLRYTEEGKIKEARYNKRV